MDVENRRHHHGERFTPIEREIKQKLFLEALSLTANVRAACVHAKVGRTTIYRWQEHDEEFSHQFHLAQSEANDLLTGEAWRRGMQGVEEPVVSMGKIVLDREGQPLVIKRYSDPLLMLLMKARMPEFREKQQVEHSGSIDFAGAAESLFAKIAAALPKEDNRNS